MILDTPELVNLPLDEVHPANDNIRTKIGDVKELAASIKAVGILEPIVVVPNGDGYTIVAGARRHAAAKVAKLSTVPCVIRPEMSVAERIEAMVIENLQRVDLTPLEEADAYQRLVDLDWTQRKIADRVGRTQPHVSKRLTLVKLPQVARDALDAGELTVEVAVELTKLDEAMQTKLIGSSTGQLSEWKVEEAIAAAAKKRKHEKLAKPLVADGLTLIGSSNWMKYDTCPRDKATHFWFDWRDEPVFVKAKPKPKAQGKLGTPTETPAQRKKREADEAAVELRRAGRAAVAGGQISNDYMIELIVDQVARADVDVDQLGEALILLGLRTADELAAHEAKNTTWHEFTNLIGEYARRGWDEAQRAFLVVGMLEGESELRWSDNPAYLRVLVDVGGYEPTKDEAKRLAKSSK